MTVTRVSLARPALGKSGEVRAEAGYDARGPVCIYEVCRRLGVEVRFVPVSMEGTYLKLTPPPDALLSGPTAAATTGIYLRAHELGHHAPFRTRLDDRRAQGGGTTRGAFNPDEFLVDSFAGFFLMPKIAVRRGVRTPRLGARRRIA